MAFEQISSLLLQRLGELFSNEDFQKKMSLAGDKKSTHLHSAIMKAVCYSQKWIKQIDVLVNQSAKEFNPGSLSDPLSS